MGESERRARPPLEMRVCRAIRLLADGLEAGQVARAVNVRPATLAAWQATDDFRALVDCLSAARQADDLAVALDDLTPGAIAALRKALAGDETRVAVQAAREVLDRVGLARRKDAPSDPPATVIRVEYGNPDGQTVAAAPWAERNPASPGALQGGGVRTPLRQDGDGQDSAG